jgi:hypothetical protein
MKGPAESGQICSVGRRKVAKKIAKNKRCYANTLHLATPLKDAVEGDEGGLGGHDGRLGGKTEKQRQILWSILDVPQSS